MSTAAHHVTGIGTRTGTQLYARWSEFNELRRDVLRSGDVEAIHDLRVASRRIRVILGVFRPLMGKGLKEVIRPIREITRQLGRLRNIDEATLYFSRAGHDLPALLKKLRTLRKREMKMVAVQLEALPVRQLDALLRQRVAVLTELDRPGSAHDLPVFLSRVAMERFRQLSDLLLPAAVPEQVEPRHAFRIAVKKWRYLLELLAQVGEGDYQAALEQLKSYQTLLGHLNDMVEFRALCHSLELPEQEQRLADELLASDEAEHLRLFLDLIGRDRPKYIFQL